MKILIIGSGGREHALGWSLFAGSRVSGSERRHELLFAPGNPGTESLGKNVAVDVADISGLVSLAKAEGVDFTIVGPELPLSLGVGDAFRAAGLVVFGPDKAGAEIEASKQFAKEIMNAAAVPTGGFSFFRDVDSAIQGFEEFTPPYVIKADGLAAGKGVVVTESQEEAEKAIRAHFESGKSEGVLLEEFLPGKEASFIVMTDGERIVPFPASNDYKRLGDGDNGPNTGGMGTVSPTAHLSEEQEGQVVETIIQPVLQELKKRNIPFVGFLYAGLMVAESGEMSVVEFNARMGDPEAQVILRRWNGDLAATLFGLASGGDIPSREEVEEQAAVCVVMASHGYPESSRKGDIISGVSEAEALGNVAVFHAGTSSHEGKLVTGGGRVLGVTALGDNVNEARLKAYDAANRISFPGQQFRKDIAL